MCIEYLGVDGKSTVTVGMLVTVDEPVKYVRHRGVNAKGRRQVRDEYLVPGDIARVVYVAYTNYRGTLVTLELPNRHLIHNVPAQYLIRYG